MYRKLPINVLEALSKIALYTMERKTVNRSFITHDLKALKCEILYCI